jgi:hypothetical protein
VIVTLFKKARLMLNHFARPKEELKARPMVNHLASITNNQNTIDNSPHKLFLDFV